MSDKELTPVDRDDIADLLKRNSETINDLVGKLKEITNELQRASV